MHEVRSSKLRTSNLEHPQTAHIKCTNLIIKRSDAHRLGCDQALVFVNKSSLMGPHLRPHVFSREIAVLRSQHRPVLTDSVVNFPCKLHKENSNLDIVNCSMSTEAMKAFRETASRTGNCSAERLLEWLKIKANFEIQKLNPPAQKHCCSR